jgi:subtilisin family serine protease
MAEYIVTVNKGVDWQQLHTELTTDTSGSPIANIPDRAVTVIKLRSTNNRITHYDLTDPEADSLKNDSRVMSVEKAGLGFITSDKIQDGNFSKTSNAAGEQQNWGLLRHTSTTNIYSTSLNDPGGTYNYVLDGTGVDVVIMDSGIQADHPEFQDANGVSRVKLINWYTESDVTDPRPKDESNEFFSISKHYTDIDGHGTHVASTVAGKTFGWAKNADIYVQTILGNKDREISIADAFDTLLGWHQKKTNPSDPSYTGRPTVVNMSWGYALYLNTNVSPNTIVDNNLQVYATLTGGSYRGDSPYNNAPHTLTERADLVSKGVTGRNAGSGYYQIPIVMNSVDTSVEQLTDAGIIVCIAAGNNSMKQDVENGDDYNNYVSYSGSYTGNGYYHRGSSPRLGSNPGFNVGAIGNQSPSTTQDEKAGYSDGGTAVNIYAAGTNIIGACSNTAPNFTGSRRVYYLNDSFWQMNINGTSMASPQIAGMVALLMQSHPDWTPTQVVNWFQNNATNKIYTTGNSDDYTVTNSLWGSEQQLAYFKLSGSKPFQYIAS